MKSRSRRVPPGPGSPIQLRAGATGQRRNRRWPERPEEERPVDDVASTLSPVRGCPAGTGGPDLCSPST